MSINETSFAQIRPLYNSFFYLFRKRGLDTRRRRTIVQRRQKNEGVKFEDFDLQKKSGQSERD